MDETEKYKQRLEAIAEKRRQQEEQERARRDLEDERLRLQQLKRKSLRDQWLMEGAPLSPTSPDTQSPRSPPWGSQAQEIEKRIDKLQSENQQLTEEEEKLKEQMEGGQTEAVKVAEAGAEMAQDGIVQNGENNTTGPGTAEDEVTTSPSALLEETTAVLTNGGGDIEVDTDHDTQPTTNGAAEAAEGDTNMKLEPELCLGVSETESGQVPNVNINKEEEEEEEEGTLVMRAERVIVTDEGDDVPEDLTPQENEQETVQPEETPLLIPEASQEGVEAVEEVVKAEAAPETFTQPEEEIEATEPTAEAQPETGDEDMQGDVEINGDGETEAKGQDKESEDPTSLQVQSPPSALEGTTVASVPVYSEAQPSTLTPELEAEGETAAEGAEAALKPQEPAILPGQFQEVPLADPQENQRTEARPAEQEPLLSQAKAPDTQAEPAAAAAAAAAASTETNSSTRANQGDETEAPKHKTCQCCSVM